MNRRNIIYALLALVLFCLPYLMREPFYAHILIMTFFYAGTASAWNILGGFAGQLSLGHAAFYGIGAYTSTLLFVRSGVSPWAGMIAGMLLVMGVAFLISYPSFKLKGSFFTMATIAFGEIMRILANFWQDLTKGAAGVSIPFQPAAVNLIFQDKMAYCYVFLGYLALVILVSLLIKRSYFGYYLEAINQNEDSAKALGVNTTRYKLYAALISAALTSAGGTLYAQYIMYLEPNSTFSIENSVQFAMMAIIGGIGTVIGPVVGAFLLTPLIELLRSFLGGGMQGLYMIIYGGVLLVVVLVIPNGIAGAWRSGRDKWRRQKKASLHAREVK